MSLNVRVKARLSGGLFILTALVGLAGCTREGSQIGSRSVAVVNGRKFSAKDFADELAIRLRQYDAVLAKNPLNVSRVKDEILNNFIHQGLLLSWAEKARIAVSKEELDEAASKVQASYPDEFAFREALAKGQRSYAEWKESLRTHVLEKKLFAELDKKMEPPADAEMELYFKSNDKLFHKNAQAKIRQIVVDKEEDALRLQKALASKTPFDELAKKFSIAPEAKNGGELGWVEKGTLEVFDKAFSLNKGAVSGVLKSPYGFHLIEVLDKKPETQLSFSDAKSKIREMLLADRQQAVYSAWLEEQMKKASVSKDYDLLRSITVETKGN